MMDLRFAGTAAPCPLCAAHIIAPQPIARGIPFATLLGAQQTPFTPLDPAASGPKPKTTASSGKVILADCNISQLDVDKKGNLATLKMLLFAIMTIIACLITALLLLRG